MTRGPDEDGEIDDIKSLLVSNADFQAPPEKKEAVVAAEPQPPDGAERRRSERIRIQLPIRVIGFDEARGRFIEDTHTIVVSNTGSLIALKHRVFAADTLRIINLENMEEADFRVVGPSVVTETEVSQWGVENVDGRNIWGFNVPEPLKGSQAGALLKCRACGKEIFWTATLLEVEVLESTGMIAMPCDDCRKPTYWIYSDTLRYPSAFAMADAVAPPPRVVPIRERAERRVVKRVLLKLPILVRRNTGQNETIRTEDMSKKGFAVSLAMDLDENEVVTVMVPYQPDGTNIPTRAQVVWKDPYPSSGRRWHGFKFVR